MAQEVEEPLFRVLGYEDVNGVIRMLSSFKKKAANKRAYAKTTATRLQQQQLQTDSHTEAGTSKIGGLQAFFPTLTGAARRAILSQVTLQQDVNHEEVDVYDAAMHADFLEQLPENCQEGEAASMEIARQHLIDFSGRTVVWAIQGIILS